MNLQSLVALVILIAFALVLFLIVWGAIVRRRAAAYIDKRRTGEGVEQAPLEQDEREASPVSEQIEQMVQQNLAALDPKLAAEVDFGTAADGSLEIWVGERRYTSPDDIDDEHVRRAVQTAVEDFNRSQGED